MGQGAGWGQLESAVCLSFPIPLAKEFSQLFIILSQNQTNKEVLWVHLCEEIPRKQALQFSSSCWMRDAKPAKFHSLISINLLTI